MHHRFTERGSVIVMIIVESLLGGSAGLSYCALMWQPLLEVQSVTPPKHGRAICLNVEDGYAVRGISLVCHVLWRAICDGSVYTEPRCI